MSRTRRLFRWGLRLGAVGLVLGIGALIWFGAWYYPAMGLAGIPKNDSRQAMDRAVRGMTAAYGLTFEDWDFLKFRQVERGGEAYTWGAARCRAADGSTAFFWVYLEWSKKRGQWLRNYSLELATPDDEIYFTRTNPGQIGRASRALHLILGQLAAHVREALAASSNPAGLQSRGL